ncbi:GNAT family protein [Bacillus sp. 31A1R]|uniref:GNAT family protein n=1 Tax=Robertmurraya mangrovi TaxID=3098077 RepID=A0ABU5ISQ1_9BACI|nr:GNAT family protein [Bacillus sp. 31A1R]MDZ5470151.1 GNAT family protein [Bacillus sp. 31A1R]
MFTLKVDSEIELQLFQIHHSEELYQLVDANREHLREWLPWVDSMNSPFQYHSIIPVWLKQFADNNGFNCGIRYKGKLVGCIGLHQIDWNNKSTSIGYYLGHHAQGNGIMTRAVQALINYIFYELKLYRIEIRCGEYNFKSRAIPERLGFTNEGTIRMGENLYGQFHNLVVYGLLANEWHY